MKKLLFFLVIVFLNACKEEEQATEESLASDSSELSVPIEIESNRTVRLTSPAQEQVANWLAYATAQNEIRSIKSATGTALINKSGPLVQIMESLQSTMPDTLKVSAVEARANVLVTKAHILHQISMRENKDAEDIFEAANNLIVEFDNFKLQLNELFLKSPEDFEMQLDREFQNSASDSADFPTD